MKEYTVRDFLQYYTNSFIVDPSSGTVGMVFHDRNNGNPAIYFGVDVPVSPENSKPIDMEKLKWSNIARPRLGYFNHKGLLFRAYVNRVNNTPKGLHRSVVAIEVPHDFVTAYNLASKTPCPELSLDVSTADTIFNPSYPKSLEAAIDTIKERNRYVGMAISHDLAVVLGVRKTAKFNLSFRGVRIATSDNGSDWILLDPEYRGVLDRYVKK